MINDYRLCTGVNRLNRVQELTEFGLSDAWVSINVHTTNHSDNFEVTDSITGQTTKLSQVVEVDSSLSDLVYTIEGSDIIPVTLFKHINFGLSQLRVELDFKTEKLG